MVMDCSKSFPILYHKELPIKTTSNSWGFKLFCFIGADTMPSKKGQSNPVLFTFLDAFYVDIPY